MKVTRLLLITVCMAVALAAWQCFIGPIGNVFQYIFFAGLVFIIGVPHGALDLYVQQQSDQLSGRQPSTVLFLLKYCGYILLYTLVWYLSPTVAFVFFLVISCLHFGETDLTYITPKGTSENRAVTFMYGTGLLLVLLLPHMAEVKVSLLQLLPAYHSLPLYIKFIQMHATVTIVCAAVAIAIILFCRMHTQPDRKALQTLLMLTLLLCSCSVMPLLPAFALYFVGWHSIISLHQIGCYMQIGNANFARQSFVLPLLKKGFLFSLLATAGLAIAVFLFHYFAIPVQPLPLVLMFLSVITLPHLRVMNELNHHLAAGKG